MLEKLTDDQVGLMDEVKNEYISLLEKKINEKDAIEGVKFVYKLAKLEEPKILILDSPLACQIACNLMKKDSRQQVWQQVIQQVRQQKTDYYNTSYDGIWIFSWMSLYDYFHRVGIVNNKLFDQYEKYVKSGVFSSIYFDKLAILSKNPILLLRDDKYRLHNQEGYAIEWADGYGQNYVHGVYFEEELFDKIFIKKEITGKEILKLKNTEQKAVAIQLFGYDKMIEELNIVKIDTYRVYNTYTGRESVSDLYEFDLDDIRIRFVKVQDHSTGKITVLGVPIEDGTKTVKGAIAWTFGLQENEYCLVKET